MSHKETYKNKSLIIEITESEESIYIKWFGKSSDREPSIFITPILNNALNDSSSNDKQIVIDFREVEYMNSSTLTPISKIIEIGKRCSHKMNIIYNKSRKWQQLSFSALKIFETNDKRIQIQGM